MHDIAHWKLHLALAILARAELSPLFLVAKVRKGKCVHKTWYKNRKIQLRYHQWSKIKLSTGEGREEKKKTCALASRAPAESFYSCHSKCVTTSKYSSSEIFSIPWSSHRHRARGWLTAAMLEQDWRDFQEMRVVAREESNRFICSRKQTCITSRTHRQTHAHDQPSKSTSKSTQLHTTAEGLETVHKLFFFFA